ncbi:MAG: bacteriocin secretion protein [Streptococcus sp.]
MSKNLRALTAIVLSQLLIECMGFFLGIPLSKILVLTVLSSIAEVLIHLVLGKKSKVTLSDKEIWHQYFLFVKKTLWLSILFVGIFLFYMLTKSDSFMLYFYWHIFVLFHCLGYIICLNNIKMNRKLKPKSCLFSINEKFYGTHHPMGIFAIRLIR